jgi:hypothetical protein
MNEKRTKEVEWQVEDIKHEISEEEDLVQRMEVAHMVAQKNCTLQLNKERV